MNHRNILTAAVLAASLGVAHASIFNPVGPQIREANNNWSLAFGHQQLTYQEQPFAAGQPSPLDSETGSMNGIDWGVRHQHAYLGWGLNLYYYQTHLGGSVTYNGYDQNLYTGALTPVSGATNAGSLGGQIFVRGGFSPIHHLALFLGVVGGGRMTSFDNRSLPGGYLEAHSNYLYGGDASAQYAIGPVVIDVSGIVGRTAGSLAFAKYGAFGNGTNFHLGNSPYHRIGFKVTYAMTKHLGLFASYHRVTFSYGKSTVNSAGFLEPSSHTRESTVQVGVRVHNFF